MRPLPSLPPSWEKILAAGFQNSAELLEYLELSQHKNTLGLMAEKMFKTRVPRGFCGLMKKGDINDPLLKQVLASSVEEKNVVGFSHDPLAEADASPIPGVLHKYASRLLLVMTGTCAINCRYCFRRHYDYSSNLLSRKHWDDLLKYLKANPAIDEVILSGGDPLLRKDDFLAELFQRIDSIQQVKTIRIHTRIPLVLPERITSDLCALLQQQSMNVVVVTHCNHGNELGQAARQALLNLRGAGLTLLNQSVLLAGVNDDVESLLTLSHRLFDAGVLPYYLHLLDKVAGSAHFFVEDHRAIELLQDLRARCSGYLVPRLAREQAGMASKTVISA